MPYSSFYGWRGLTSVLKGDRLGQYVFFLVMMRHRTASWYTVVASPHKNIFNTCFFHEPSCLPILFKLHES